MNEHDDDKSTAQPLIDWPAVVRGDLRMKDSSGAEIIHLGDLRHGNRHFTHVCLRQCIGPAGSIAFESVHTYSNDGLREDGGPALVPPKPAPPSFYFRRLLVQNQGGNYRLATYLPAQVRAAVQHAEPVGTTREEVEIIITRQPDGKLVVTGGSV